MAIEEQSEERRIGAGLRTIRTLRFFRLTPLLVLIAILLAANLVGFVWPSVGDKLLHSDAIEFVARLAFIAVLAAMVLNFIIARAHCPRCGGRFHMRMDYGTWYGNAFARRCLNCALPLDGTNAGR